MLSTATTEAASSRCASSSPVYVVVGRPLIIIKIGLLVSNAMGRPSGLSRRVGVAVVRWCAANCGVGCAVLI